MNLRVMDVDFDGPWRQVSAEVAKGHGALSYFFDKIYADAMNTLTTCKLKTLDGNEMVSEVEAAVEATGLHGFELCHLPTKTEGQINFSVC